LRPELSAIPMNVSNCSRWLFSRTISSEMSLRSA
jgi:hypothetical protein